MFRTVTVHPQEVLFRYCMCRLWYVLIRPAGTTFLPKTLYQLDVSSSAFLTTYHSLHIQYLQRSSWGWTVTVRNMYSWHLSTNKHLISATTLCISLDYIYIAKMIRGPSNVTFLDVIKLMHFLKKELYLCFKMFFLAKSEKLGRVFGRSLTKSEEIGWRLHRLTMQL